MSAAVEAPAARPDTHFYRSFIGRDRQNEVAAYQAGEVNLCHFNFMK